MFRRTLLLVLALALLVAGTGAGRRRTTTDAAALALAGHASLQFVENVGQFDPAVRFAVQGSGATLFITDGTDGALWLMVSPEPVSTAETADAESAAVRLTFPGASQPAIVPVDPLAASVSYFLGDDPSGWHSGAPVYAGVHLEGLYPGIDLQVSGADGRLHLDLSARAGADLSPVQLRLEGAGQVTVDAARGVLALSTAVGELALPLLNLGDAAPATGPVQQVDDQTFLVASPFTAVRDQAGQWDSGAADLLYSTYLGGSSLDQGNAVALDAAGNVYVTGLTSSTNLPVTTGAYRTGCSACSGGHPLAFVAKLTPGASGKAGLVYSTYLGGSVAEAGTGIAVDAGGNAYLTGYTSSPDFPVTAAAVQPRCGSCGAGSTSAFLVKLNASGTGLVYSTFLGGSGSGGRAASDRASGIALAGSGEVFIAGHTNSADFPVTGGAFQRNCGACAAGGNNGFVAELDAAAAGNAGLLYSTFLGGSCCDIATGIALDTGGNAYVTGYTGSADFPTTSSAVRTAFAGGSDAFVVKLNPGGRGRSDLLYGTYLGGPGDEFAYGIAVDNAGNAYVTGWTSDAAFPVTAGVVQKSCAPCGAGGTNAFAAKLNPKGAGNAGLVYSTFLGGSGNDGGQAIAVDTGGNAYIAGTTESSNFPVTGGAFQTANGGGGDAFLTKLTATANALLYSTYVGGGKDESADGVAVGGGGIAYLTGSTSSANFPTTTSAFASASTGSNDAFVTGISTLAAAAAPGAATPFAPVDGATGVSVAPHLQWQTPGGVVVGTTQYVITVYSFATAGYLANLAVNAGSAVPGSAVSYTVPSGEGLRSGQKYAWRLVTCNGTSCSKPSAWSSFTVGAASPSSAASPAANASPAAAAVTSSTPAADGSATAPGSVTPLAPADGAVGVSTTPVLQWQVPDGVAAGSTRYIVTTYSYATGGYLANLSVQASDATAGDTVSFALPGGEGLQSGAEYAWRVVACNSTLCSAAATWSRFTTQ